MVWLCMDEDGGRSLVMSVSLISSMTGPPSARRGGRGMLFAASTGATSAVATGLAAAVPVVVGAVARLGGVETGSE